MSSVAPPSPPKHINVHSRQWIVNDMRPSTFPPPILNPIFDPPDKLDAFLDAVRRGAAFTADEKNIQAPFRSGIDIEDDLSRLFAFEEPPLGLRAMWVVANEAGQEITFAKAKEIVAEAKKKRRPRRQKAVPADKLGLRLIKMLRRYQERWPVELSDLARHLREFVDALDMRGKKKARG